MTIVERVARHRKRKEQGLRAVPVLLSKAEIEFLMAHEYELSPSDPRSIGKAVAQFLSDSASLLRPSVERVRAPREHRWRRAPTRQPPLSFGDHPRAHSFV
jgi:hypothetical protein